MNLLPVRYSAIRQRLIELYKVLQYKTFPLWIAPEFLMTTEDLRSRYTYTQEGSFNDHGCVEQPELREFEVVRLFRYLENFRDHTNIGFKNANVTCVEMYESIQEYLSLWCELIRANVMRSPPMTELRNLENVAYLIFPHYAMIKPYRRNQEMNERYQNDQRLNANGLAGFAALFGMYRLGNNREEEISFVSHLDALNSNQDIMPSMNAHVPTYLPTNQSMDSLSRVESGAAPSWPFVMD